ncbi:MAG: n-acetylglutamate synthase, partial [Flaviaesturariibacter sp.]|nr:n-acetylglutamate synthase [Flaviaesturariibacter sp.]
KGGAIVSGQLIAVCNEAGALDMRYHHINTAGELLAGTCRSIPKRLPSGAIRLHESWQWTGGKAGTGQSSIEEII